MRLVTFFLQNARVLESMKLVVDYDDKYNDRWFERQHKKLQPNTRASKGAKFTFELPRSTRVHNLPQMIPLIDHRVLLCPSDDGLSCPLVQNLSDYYNISAWQIVGHFYKRLFKTITNVMAILILEHINKLITI